MTTTLNDFNRVSTLPFSSSVNRSEAAQHIIRITKCCLSSILMLCNERNPEGLRSATWVLGWEFPRQRSFERAITPAKPTTAFLTTLVDDCFGQVSRALEDGATGPEAFTLLLRLPSGHFVHADSGAGCEKSHTFWRA